MYINPFFVGVFCTLVAEAIVFGILVWYFNKHE